MPKIDGDYLELYIYGLKFGVLPLLVSVFLSVYISMRLTCAAVNRKKYFAPVFTFATIGAGMGYFIGASRDAAVGAVVPALAVFISGVAAYQFAKSGETYEPFRALFPPAISAMLIAAIFFTPLAAASRQKTDSYNREVAQRQTEAALLFELGLTEYRLWLERVAVPLALESMRREAGFAPAPDAPASEVK